MEREDSKSEDLAATEIELIPDEEDDVVLKKVDMSQSQEVCEIDWKMFVKETELGSGAYGNVYKVRSLESTKTSSAGERILLSKKSLKKANETHLAAKRNATGLFNSSNRSLLKD